MRRLTEAAKVIGVSAVALRRWTRRGLVPYSSTPGGRNFYSDADLDEIRSKMIRRPERVAVAAGTE